MTFGNFFLPKQYSDKCTLCLDFLLKKNSIAFLSMWVSIVSPTMPYPALCLFLEAAILAEAECSPPMSEPPAKRTVLTPSHLLCLKEKYSQNSFVCISPVDHRSAVPVTHFQQTGG